MNENKLTQEVAEQEFERMAEIWDIDTDESGFDEDDLESFIKAKKPLIKSLMDGSLVVDEDGNATFTLRWSKKLMENGTETITLDPSRPDVLVMDKFKERETMHKMRAYIASMASKPLRIIGQIDPRDEKRLRGAVLLFLGS